MALKQVKNKIIATQKTAKVTKAMEAVSAVKMRKSQTRAIAGKQYAEAAMRVLYRVSKSIDAKEFFNGSERGTGLYCYVIVTSDKGLAGSLNSSVIRETEIALRKHKKEGVALVIFGKKAYEYFLRQGYQIDDHHLNVSDDVSLEDMQAVVRMVNGKFNSGLYRQVSITYQSFISTFEQNAILRQILPLDPLCLETIIRDIVPKKGAYSELESDLSSHLYTIEPNAQEVMRALIPQLTQIMVYHALLENKASEHSARMVAMKNATDKAKEVTKTLTVLFNKERQASITSEVSEITGGIEAMKS